MGTGRMGSGRQSEGTPEPPGPSSLEDELDQLGVEQGILGKAGMKVGVTTCLGGLGLIYSGRSQEARLSKKQLLNPACLLPDFSPE